jgi:hypothetical protein
MRLLPTNYPHPNMDAILEGQSFLISDFGMNKNDEKEVHYANINVTSKIEIIEGVSYIDKVPLIHETLYYYYLSMIWTWKEI